MWVPRGSSPDEKGHGRKREINPPLAHLTVPLARLASSSAAAGRPIVHFFADVRTCASRPRTEQLQGHWPLECETPLRDYSSF